VACRIKAALCVIFLTLISRVDSFSKLAIIKARNKPKVPTLFMSLLVSNVESFNTNVKLILASRSPRRREILDMMGLKEKYDTIPSPLDESLLQSRLREGGENSIPDPINYTRILAEEKAKALAETLQVSIPTFVIGSDTIVDLNGNILEKPSDSKGAIKMLRRLSDSSHQVHTGVAIYRVLQSGVELVSSFTDTTTVQFVKLSDEDIHAYVATEEPMDKAGSYGIQGIGGQLVKRIEGDFFTVMGLPMNKLSSELARVVKHVIE